MSMEALRDFAGVVALIALLAVAYGTVARAIRPPGACLVLGALFGGAAVLTLFDPVRLAPGVIVDMRALPLTLAGAFLRRPGALLALGIAAAARWGIGGPGALPGIVAMAVAVGAGMGWARWDRAVADDAEARGEPGEVGAQGWGSLAVLAVLSAAHVLTTLLLPANLVWVIATSILPVVVPLHVAGVMLVGSLLRRERALLDAERRLAHAAERDALTGLLNRRGLERAARRPGPLGGPCALLMLDLDHFKRVNDDWGHAGGDAVLRGAAERLRAALRPDDLLARVGGEEMVALLPAASAAEAASVARRLCEALRERPFTLADGTVAVTGSVGCAWSAGPARLSDLLDRADAALYRAKRAGRDRVAQAWAA